jgi:predicted nucleic acid-binding protein
MSFVALDSTIVMILAGAHSAELRAKERADDLIAYHREKHHHVAIPAAALAECCHCDERIWNQLLVLDLNAAAAMLANRLTPPLKTAAKGRATRQSVKTDALILATAEIRGASILYTTDDWFATVAASAKLKIKVMGLPQPSHKQQRLPNPEGGSI